MLSECFLKFRGGFPRSQPALPVLPISTGVFTINAGSESSLSDWLNRHGVLCHHQDLWPVQPLGSSPASWPPHWAGWLRAPSLTTPGSQGAGSSGLLCAPTFPLTGMDKPSLCWSRKKEVRSQPQGDPWRGPHPLRGPGHLTEMWGIMEAGGASVPALWLRTH